MKPEYAIRESYISTRNGSLLVQRRKLEGAWGSVVLAMSLLLIAAGCVLAVVVSALVHEPHDLTVALLGVAMFGLGMLPHLPLRALATKVTGRRVTLWGPKVTQGRILAIRTVNSKRDLATTIGRLARRTKSVHLVVTGGMLFALGFITLVIKGIMLPSQPNEYINADGVTIIDGMVTPHQWITTVGLTVLLIGKVVLVLGWLRSRLPHNEDETPTITDAR